MNVKINAKKVCYGFNNFQKLGTILIKLKSPIVRRFLVFQAKLPFQRSWVLSLVPFYKIVCLFFHCVTRTLHQLPEIHALSLVFYFFTSTFFPNCVLCLIKNIYPGTTYVGTRSISNYFYFSLLFYCSCDNQYITKPDEPNRSSSPQLSPFHTSAVKNNQNPIQANISAAEIIDQHKLIVSIFHTQSSPGRDTFFT